VFVKKQKDLGSGPTGSLPVLPYGRQWLDDDDLEAVLRVLRGEWLTQGPAVAAFEDALAAACEARFAVAVSSGTAALHLACLAAGVGPGDVGVTSPITFVASANAVAYCGGTPAFADVDARTACMDPAALEEVCARRRPRVILPVDFAGQPADLPAIHAVARLCRATVIQDAAHSLGASYEHAGAWHKVGACKHADMTTLSFHPVKHITTGEGGAILTNSPDLYKRLMRLRTHGVTKEPADLSRADGPWYYEQHDLGFNYRITDVQCALGLSQLTKLERFVKRRRELAEEYRRGLADAAAQVEVLPELPGRLSSYHLLVVRLRQGGAQRRRAIYDRLHASGIRAQVHYYPVHLQPWYREWFGFREGSCPRAEAYYQTCLSLPLFPRMSEGDVRRVVHALRQALAETA
jgi:UDP-4-amino-4,6-dideoxy-N-acetyl-beta-L-altrosamine transaminase